MRIYFPLKQPSGATWQAWGSSRTDDQMIRYTWDTGVSRLRSWSWLVHRDRIPEASQLVSKLVSKLAQVAFQGTEGIVHPAPGG